ncbi:hypothetical protein BD410DRAFT_847051 [Rickenella mellea]|uniref:Uncharacterized protein n=1 Tax=Rickenella mellea TaxID=50990 RepID=A0A4Y7PEV4_9AGAM|nr:hypothetical protein BD410DRAFT_847051 [Rickenella mellea]
MLTRRAAREAANATAAPQTPERDQRIIVSNPQTPLSHIETSSPISSPPGDWETFPPGPGHHATVTPTAGRGDQGIDANKLPMPPGFISPRPIGEQPSLPIGDTGHHTAPPNHGHDSPATRNVTTPEPPPASFSHESPATRKVTPPEPPEPPELPEPPPTSCGHNCPAAHNVTTPEPAEPPEPSHHHLTPINTAPRGHTLQSLLGSTERGRLSNTSATRSKQIFSTDIPDDEDESNLEPKDSSQLTTFFPPGSVIPLNALYYTTKEAMLFDLEIKPWHQIKPRTDCKPQNEAFAELLRRISIHSVAFRSAPDPSTWE